MKILLAMDTSQASQVALEQISARPWPAGSAIGIVGVIEPSHLWTTSEVALESARRAKEVVERAVEQLRAKQWDATGIVLSGDPKAVILDHARSMAVDFIVVGSHGTSAVTKLVLGSVAAAILRHAPCPVEIVRAGGGNSPASKVLLATDGSEFSDLAVRSVAERPWPANTEIRVLSAVELILPDSRAFFEPPFVNDAVMETARTEAMKRAQDAIAAAGKILSTTALTVSESVSVLLEKPKTIILDEASQWGADLIVLGLHGHRGVDRFLLGSVSEAVALHAECSVEVIRRQER